METEKTIYQASPSQIRNLQPFLFSLFAIAAIIVASVLAGNNIILIALILPVIYAFWKWLEIKSTSLTITDERIIVSEGVLNKTTN